MAQEQSKTEPVWTFRAAEHLILKAQDAARVLGISRSEFIRRAIEAAVGERDNA